MLGNLARRMAEGENIKPATQAEKDCFQVIRDLDHVSSRVDGSLTSKKYMRSEIWSLMAYFGAPSWYITLSPADVKHPICLYFADTKEKFCPDLRLYEERIKLIARNPVAGARFFHFMVELFIKHILGVGTDHAGIYGETSAYYGTVEQQGRLTLHLHLLLWIRGCLSPQEIRDRILDPDSDFRVKLLKYLESCHIGEFLTGSQTDVTERVASSSEKEQYIDPTQSLPKPPPTKACGKKCGHCVDCKTLQDWCTAYENEVDDLILKSNVHRCSDFTAADKLSDKSRPRRYVGCIDSKTGKCKARFPCEIVPATKVDPESGAIKMKKLEPLINTLTAPLTYLMRCNTDVTSLKSGTALKAVIMYVTDYITKSSLKTHILFDIIKSTYQKNSEMIGGSESRHATARCLITKMVINISAKLVMGSPMICMYLLKNPDHYTNHQFAPFYWKNYVVEACRPWRTHDFDNEPVTEKVALLNRKGKIMGLSTISDFICRPRELEDMCLYDWVRRCSRVKVQKSKKDKKSSTEQVIRVDSNESDEEQQNDSDASLSNASSASFLSDSENVKSTQIPCGRFDYLKGHPLFDTHKTRCLPENKALVPNFIGETLPRRDRGDREWYCATMLTLFCPWRSGLDLKQSTQTWDEAFTSHQFSKRQLEVMDNFNLRYECLDASDDFHQEMKKGSTGFHGWNDIVPSRDLDDDIEDTGSHSLTKYEIDVEVDSIGKREAKRQHEMSVIKGIMQQTGWTDPLKCQTLNERESPTLKRTGAQWKAEIKRMRQAIIDGSQKVTTVMVRNVIPNVHLTLSYSQIKRWTKSK